jgi:hypothetical protein
MDKPLDRLSLQRGEKVFGAENVDAPQLLERSAVIVKGGGVKYVSEGAVECFTKHVEPKKVRRKYLKVRMIKVESNGLVNAEDILIDAGSRQVGRDDALSGG